MFVNTLDPVIFSIGPVDIRYYGLAYVLGFFLIWWALHKKHQELKLTKDEVSDFAFWLMVGVVVGSRLYSTLVWSPGYYLADPIKIFYVWEGGMAFHGGLIGAVIAAYWFCKKKKISLAKTADILIIPAIIALAIGRLANFANQELYGPVTDIAWCVKFNTAEGCRHPYQIYSFLKRMAVAGILALLNKKEHKDGYLFWMGMLLIGVGRFFLDFYREDVLYAGLSIGQWSSLVLAAVSAVILFRYYRKKQA